jgi:hypothetical protein
MPPLPQRRNAAYLNRLNSRFGLLDRGLDEQALMPCPGLAIDLGSSVEWRFRPASRGDAYLDELLLMIAPLDRGAKATQSLLLRICAF